MTAKLAFSLLLTLHVIVILTLIMAIREVANPFIAALILVEFSIIYKCIKVLKGIK
jgi:hypothetical protein